MIIVRLAVPCTFVAVFCVMMKAERLRVPRCGHLDEEEAV